MINTINENGVIANGVNLVNVTDGGYAIKLRFGLFLIGIRLRGSTNSRGSRFVWYT